jgi:type IV pilus assembly protein PilM
MGLFSKQIIGIDIGHSSVKVVGLEVSGSQAKFIGCKEITMDPKYLQKEGFENAELIGQALREAMRTAAPHALATNPTAYSAISESLVFRKVLDLPLIDDQDELLSAIRLEATEYLPESPDNMEIDYQLLGLNPDSTMQQVMIVAVSKKIIQDYLAVFVAAKLPIKAIDTKPAAVARSVVKPTEMETILLVDIGSEISTISLYSEGVIRVTGSLNIGGNIIRDDETMEIEEDKKDEHIKRLATSIADEIDHVIKFYTNRTVNQKKIKEIRLAGGGSMIAGVLEAIKKETDFEVTSGQAIITLPPFCDRRFLGALGCALYPVFEGA